MKNIPAFATPNGIAGLILKEIPYRSEAYVTIHDSREPRALAEECLAFCRACGAEKVYLKGDSYFGEFSLHTAVWEYRGRIQYSEEDLPEMFPVTERTVSQWRELYNAGMRNVDNAATLEYRDENEILTSGGAYFIHRGSSMEGIGWLQGNELKAVVSFIPGCGAEICRAFQSLIPEECIVLQVASTNLRAVNLYERLGLIRVREISRWYRLQ